MRHLAFALCLLAAPVSAPVAAQVQGVELEEPVPMPDFAFSNPEGASFTHEDLKGAWTVVMFGFNSCPDVCPFTLANLEAAIQETSMRVSPANVPQVVFVSVDPDRDAEVVGEYAAYFHPDFLGVTGTRGNIDTLIEATDSFYRLMPPDATGFYDVQHSSAVSVFDPDGMLRAKLQPPFDPGMTAEFLARLQISWRRGPMN